MNKITVNDLMGFKKEGKKITMLTAYDYYSAKFLEEAGIDIILVGDSLGMVMQGHNDTLPVTLDEIIYHTKMVKRGASNAMVVSDLPFMTYQCSREQAMKTAGRIMKESGAGAVKLEGGKRVIPQVEALVKAGIPVMGHLGLTPQSINQFSGFKVQGKEKKAGLKLIEDALALQEAGVFSIVLETVPAGLAKIITGILNIPTIGIGAGVHCDGQVLVFHDFLGFDKEFRPKFARKYVDLAEIIVEAASKYKSDVKKKKFPDEEESFHMNDEILEEIIKELEIDEDF